MSAGDLFQDPLQMPNSIDNEIKREACASKLDAFQLYPGTLLKDREKSQASQKALLVC